MAMEVTGVWLMWEYIRRRQATITRYIVENPIFELCMRAERRKESSRFIRWWDQDHGQAEEGLE